MYPQGSRSGLTKLKKEKELILITATTNVNLPQLASNDLTVQIQL